MTSALAALTFLLSAHSGPIPARHFLGQSAFSFASDGELKVVRSETLDRPGEWMVKANDWEIDAKDIYVAASMFEGREGTKMDRAFLKDVVTEFVTGMEGDKDVAKITLSDATTIDDQLALRTNYRIGGGQDAMFVQSIFLASGTNLYSLIAVYFEESGTSAESAKKVVESVRFKRPLPDTAFELR